MKSLNELTPEWLCAGNSSVPRISVLCLGGHTFILGEDVLAIGPLTKQLDGTYSYDARLRSGEILSINSQFAFLGGEPEALSWYRVQVLEWLNAKGALHERRGEDEPVNFTETELLAIKEGITSITEHMAELVKRT